jgi:hypothetical protein
MSTPTYSLDFTARALSAEPAARSVRRAPGMLRRTTFLVARASVYLLVLPLAALVSLTGIVLYAAQSLIGPPRG